MARQILSFTEGEHGFDHTFHAFNEDKTVANLASFTAVRLVIKDEVTDTEKLNITTDLTISSPDVVWAIQNGQTDFNGEFIAVLHLTAVGVLEKTFQLPCVVDKKLV